METVDVRRQIFSIYDPVGAFSAHIPIRVYGVADIELGEPTSGGQPMKPNPKLHMLRSQLVANLNSFQRAEEPSGLKPPDTPMQPTGSAGG